MTHQDQELLRQAYAAFNARDIDAVLSLMHPQVRWPNGWEGGHVNGHEEVRAYWTRQWKELDPQVEPVGFKQRPSGAVEVAVHQRVKDRKGDVLFDGLVKHVYTLEQGKIQSMEIEKG